MSQYAQQDKVWLIKSSGKILGPYSTDEMKFLLERRKISIIDEVRNPEMRWGFIRENPNFEEVISTLRDQEAHSIDQTTEAGQRTRTITAVPMSDEFTPTPRPLNMTPQVPTADLKNVAKESIPKREEVKHQAMGFKPGVQSKWSSIGLGPVILALALILLGGVGYHCFQNSTGSQKSISTDDLVRLARAHKNLGLYDKSLGFYRKAESIKPLDISSSIQMAILMLEGTNQSGDARRIIETETKKMNSNDPLRVDSQLALGLSYLKEGNYSKSEEVFQSILFADENQKEARLNVGISKMLRSDFSGALKEFNLSIRKGSTDGILVLSRAIAHLGLNEGAGDIPHLKSSVEDVERYISTASEYRLEALLLKAVLLQKLGSKEQALKTAARLLEEDPRLTQDHIHSLLIDRQLVRWDRLAMYCDFLTLKWGDSAISRGLNAFCTLQRQDYQPALTKLEDARGQFPKSTELTSQHAYLLFQQKRISEAQKEASLAESESTLAQRVMALSCEELGNWDCADQKWRRIILGNGQDLGALRGLAQYQWMKNHREQALGFIKTGLTVSESYRPLKELQEKLDAL